MSHLVAALNAMFAASACAQSFNPSNPAASGYVLTFNGTFGGNAIDINNTLAPGYQWYVAKPSGWPVTTSSELSVSNGVLTISPNSSESGGGSTQWMLASAAPANNSQGYVGQAFGGGFYVEASIAFNSSQVNTANGWPTVWGEALEGTIGTAQWPGQATGYVHYAEDDFIEYVTSAWAGNYFASTMHDWYGIWGQTTSTCNSTTHCNIVNSNNLVTLGSINWTNFNTIGQLWVPGSAANGYQGYVTTYFNGQPVMTQTWIDQGNGVPPPGGNFTYSIIDQDHLVIILGTGIGQPMKVQWVHVWQLSGSGSTSAGAAISGPTSAGAAIIGKGQQLVDGSGNVWTLSGGVVYENGQTAGYSAMVTNLIYSNNVIYQGTSFGGWWSWTGATWAASANPV